MDEEIERGRLAGLKIRRAEAAQWAESMVPILAQARQELTEYADRGAPSNRAIAEWLTNHQVPTRKGKAEWQSEQVSRLLDIQSTMIKQAESEYSIAIHLLMQKIRRVEEDRLHTLIGEYRQIKTDRENAIREALILGGAVKGDNDTDLFVSEPRPKIFKLENMDKLSVKASLRDAPQNQLTFWDD